MNVKLTWLLPILCLFGALIGLQYWAGGKWRENQGPEILAKDQKNNLYISYGSNILQFDTEGRFVEQRKLHPHGIAQLLGNMAFFPNGDFLIVPQSRQATLMEKFLTFYRISQSDSSHQKTTGSRLSRCDRQEFKCHPLPEFNEEFSRTVWMDIDEDENIFIADTARHRLYWLNANGKILDMLYDMENIQFPNQVKRDGNSLLVANSNNNSLTRIILDDKKFSRNFQHFKFNDNPDMQSGDRWTAGIVTLGDDYYTLVQNDNMMKGSVYRMSRDGKIKSMLERKSDADPISLVSFRNEILVADYHKVRVDRFDASGKYLGEFITPELQAAFEPMRENQRVFFRIEHIMKRLFWAVLMFGFFLSYWLERRYKKNSHTELVPLASTKTSNLLPPQIDDKRIVWIQQRWLIRNINKWFLWFWVPAMLISLPNLFSAEEESVRRNSIYIALHGLTLLEYLRMRRNLQFSLGALAPWIIFKDSESNADVIHENDLSQYSSRFGSVLMGGKSECVIRMYFGFHMFEGKQANEYLDRILLKTRPITFKERLMWIFENRLSAVLWSIFWIAFYMILEGTIRQ